MGLEFLARVRRTTIWLAAVTALMVATYGHPAHGLAVALGAVWSLINLFLIEKLVVALTTPGQSRPQGPRIAVLSIGGMALLFAAGGLMLTRLAPLWLAAGFTIHLLVITLKAASLLLLPSGFWRRLTSSTWRSAALVGALVLGAWLLATGARGPAAGGAPPRHDGRLAAAAPSAEQEPAALGEEPGAAESHAGESKEPQKFPNLITLATRFMPEGAPKHFLHSFEVMIFSLLVALLLCVAAITATRGAQLIPGPLQNVVEWLVETLYDFVVGILGPKHGPRFVPFLGTQFIYILAMNLFGLIPFMDSPTSSLNVTVALALVVFIYAQWIGLRELGVLGYVDHMAGNPRSVIGWVLVPLMLPIHLMGEVAKPISLSARLFGNIFGEDMLLVAFATLGISTLSFAHLPFGIPFQLPFLFLALLTSTLQALVFTVLSTIYFLLMLPHDEHEHEAEAAHAH